MQEETDDIGKFFKKRLSEKEFPFEEEQWDILANKLDDAGLVKTPFWLRFRKRIGYILIPILTFLIGWYWHKVAETSNVQDTLPASKAPMELPANEEGEPVIAETDELEQQESVADLETQSKAVQEAKPNALLLAERVKPEEETELFNSSSLVQNSKLNASSDEFMQEGKTLTVPPIGNKILSFYEVAPLRLLELNFPPAQVQGWIELPKGDSLMVEEKTFNPFWSATVLVAPDFSSTNAKDLFNSLGQTVGLQFTRYSKEKSVWSFGLLLNNKIYTAGKGEYSPSLGYSRSGVEPDLTDARCLVLEIPVSFGMRLFKTNRGSVWTNLGLSSFLFLTEKYSYFYDEYDPSLSTGWEGKNENKHIAAAVGISFVYAHQLSERSSLIFEPYFKTTIQPVGHGNVDLLSSGVNVGFNYKLFSKN
jgi:hypothetical protein